MDSAYFYGGKKNFFSEKFFFCIQNLDPLSAQ